MADLAHVVGGDLQVSPSGDLTLVDSDSETQQRVLHRLLTGQSSYIWNLSYGAGLPGLVGSLTSQQQIAAIIRTQLELEVAVAKSPEPSISLSAGSPGLITVTITYTNAISGNDQILNLPIGG